MDRIKNILIFLITSLVIFFFVIAMLVISYLVVLSGAPAQGIVGFFIHYHIHFMFLLGIMGVCVGIVSYIGFTAQRKDVQHSHNLSRGLIYKFLDSTEKRIITYLLEHEKTTQSQLSRLKDIGKVKSFRTLQRLSAKELIILEPYGKTNQVRLHPDIETVLKENKEKETTE